MPLYEYECKEGHVSMILASIDDRPRTVSCDGCDGRATRIISRPTIFGSGEEYMDENLAEYGSSEGFVVKSRAHKRQRLKDLGLVERDPTYISKQRQRTGKLTFSAR